MDWENIDWGTVAMNIISIAGTGFGAWGVYISKKTLRKTSDVETILQSELEKQKMSLKFTNEYSTLHSGLEMYVSQLEEYDLSKNVISLLDKDIKRIFQFSKSENWKDREEIEKFVDWFSGEYNNFLSMINNTDDKVTKSDDKTKINILIQKLHTINSILEKEGTLHDVGQNRKRIEKNKRKN